MPIYWRLREVLDEKGVTPLELAKRLGVKHPSVYRLAAQRHVTRITDDKLDAICKALDCQPGDLLIRKAR